jgi:hypothetical protein
MDSRSRRADACRMTVDSRLLQRWTYEREMRMRQHGLVALGMDDDLAADPFREAGSVVRLADKAEEKAPRVLYLVTDDR